MRAPNHIAGGLVFTATFASFWNVNIFSDWKLLLLTIFASLLPDIDHSKSIIGKAFFPIAKWLDKRYGHRTITHSLAFFIVTSIIVYLIEFHTPAEHIYMIFSFALLSHLLFDMMTIQGIPLFYPFKRNPCVIPADPNIRLKGGSAQETAVFGFFILIMWFSYPLFEHGFWMTYNNKFATLSHLNSSNRKSDKILEVDFDFTENSNAIKGSGLLVYSEDGKANIWLEEVQQIITITSKAVLNDLTFKNSNFPKIYQEFNFSAISVDSVNTLLSEGLIINAGINSSENFFYDGKERKEIELNYQLNPKISDLLKKDLEREKTIELKESEIQHKKQLKKLFDSQKNQLISQKETVKDQLKNQLISDYMRENLYYNLKEIEKEIEKIKPFDDDISKLISELEIFKKVSTEAAKYYGRGRLLKLAKKEENKQIKLEASF
jgi:inner membrane protein